MTTVGENVVVMTPVYNIFFNSIINNGRNILKSRLRYEICCGWTVETSLVLHGNCVSLSGKIMVYIYQMEMNTVMEVGSFG